MNGPARERLWREGALATLLYAALTLVLAYPLTRHPASVAVPMGADTNLLLWLLQWGAHGLTHDPLSIFDANIFHPFRHTLAYAENVIGSAILAAPVLWLSNNPVLALNVVTLASIVLCGTGAHLLARQLGIGRIGALVAGVIFAFAPPRFFRFGQLHLTTVQWMPFCLLFLHRYLDTGRRQSLWLACAFFTLQALTSGHGAVFTAISVAALLGWRAVWGEPILLRARLRDLGIPGLLLLAPAALVFVPYRAAQLEVGLRRTLRDAYQFTPNAASFLASPSHLHMALLSRFTDGWVLREARALLFPGYLTIVLAAGSVLTRLAQARYQPDARDGWTRAARTLELLAAIAFAAAIAITSSGGFRLRWDSIVLLSARQPWRAWTIAAVLLACRALLLPRVPLAIGPRLRQALVLFKRLAAALRADVVAFYGTLAAFSLWLALGPPFALYRWVHDLPGFSFIRVPARFTLITLLCAAILAAWTFDRWTARLSVRGRRAAGIAVLALLVAEFFSAPLYTIPYSVEIPPVDRWLASRPAPFVVAEVPVPITTQVERDQRNSLYMLHAAAHWQKTIHGYSGTEPALLGAVYNELATFPDDGVLADLAALGVTYVVVHGSYYPDDQWVNVKARLAEHDHWLTLEHSDGRDRVYSLRQPQLDVLLERRHHGLAAAFAASDPVQSIRYYANDAVVATPGGTILRGRAAIAGWMAGESGGPLPAVDLAMDDVVLAGHEGYVTGTFTLAPSSAADGSAAQQGRYVEVWRFVDRRWQLAYQLLTTAPPAQKEPSADQPDHFFSPSPR